MIKWSLIFHLGQSWYHSEPSDVRSLKTNFLVWTFLTAIRLYVAVLVILLRVFVRYSSLKSPWLSAKTIKCNVEETLTFSFSLDIYLKVDTLPEPYWF